METLAANNGLCQRLKELTEFYETLSPGTLDRFADFYATAARFKDPFNDVSGRPAIERIFRHMFEQLEDPRFVVTGAYLGDGASAGEAMLRWELHFKSRTMGKGPQCIVGSTLLTFDASGRVTLHRDYWDAAEELFSKLPLIGTLTRALRRQLAAT
jgi:steroid delta-isomerase